jgi:large subunit ribosomal protein L29
MKIDELRALSSEELKAKRLELSKELSLLKLQNATGQLENPMKVRTTRRDIAQVETVLNEVMAQGEESTEDGS